MTNRRSSSPKTPKKAGPNSARFGEDTLDAAGFLLGALGTSKSHEKKAFADRGLALLALLGNGDEAAVPGLLDGEDDDADLFALLLRQKYLAEIEEGHDEAALRIAERMIDLGTLGDIARQDAARAAIGIDDIDCAIGHLRIAARVCPASRRAFHYAHLGSLLRFFGQLDQAIDAFSKAIRWATEDRDIYKAQHALAEVARGRSHADLQQLRSSLENDERMKAYALWILGELCVVLGDTESGAEYLRQFLSRQISAPRAKALSLKGEVAHAYALLEQIST